VQERTQRRVLAIYAHPDDAEIWAGGTLLAHRSAGDHIAVCVLTHGDGARAVEAARGAALLGATLHHLSFTDRALALASGVAEAVAAVLRREQPHIILTHWQEDSHPDHRATWEITSAAILLSGAEADLEAVFWSDTYNGIGTPGPFPADAFVDVSDVWNAKIAAIMEHHSQEPDQYREMVGRQCAMHGAVCGISLAEGFRRVPFMGTGRHAGTTLWDFC